MYNHIGDKMTKIDKIILIVISLIIFIPIILNEINEYNLRMLKEETLEISKTLKNEYAQITQINIEKNKEIKNGLRTRGKGKAFVEGENVIVILSYKDYCSVKIEGIDEVSLSKSKCQNLELIDGEIVLVK